MKRLATFLLDHGIVFSNGFWWLYGKYRYESLVTLIYKEHMWPLMEEVYKIKIDVVYDFQTKGEEIFHQLSLVKNQS